MLSRHVVVCVLLAMAFVPPPSISITPDNPSITVGATVQLTARDASGNPVTAVWTSATPSVATVSSSGLVTGVAAGASVITAKVGNKKAMTTVTVTGGGPVTLTVTGPTSVPVGQTAQYQAFQNGQPITPTGWWFINGSSAATIHYQTGILTAVSVGMANVQFDHWVNGAWQSSTPYPVTITSGTPPPAGVGPQSSITCPGNAVNVLPGQLLQQFVNNNVGATTFCLKAGTHFFAGPVTPKTGNVFVGEYGAIVDGSQWMSSLELHYAAFMCHNQNIDNVTIRNLVIRDFPARGIHAHTNLCDAWTVESNEIAFQPIGLSVNGVDSIIRFNWIHDNVGNLSGSGVEQGGAWIGEYTTNLRIEDNEVGPNNGPQTKYHQTWGTQFRRNFLHHNYGDALWLDGDNIDAVYEANRIEDNGRMGIHHEASGNALIFGNTIKRNAAAGIYISTSRDTEIYNNYLEANFRGIHLLIQCAIANLPAGGYPRQISYDLRNNNIHDNTVIAGTQSGAWVGSMDYFNCTSAQLDPYLSNAKMNIWQSNHYQVPDVSGVYWLWLTSFKNWAGWQALGHDTSGTVQ